MDEFYTRCMDDIEKKEDKASVKDEGPQRQTLEFLRQFARTYRAEKILAPELRSYVIN